MALRLTFSIFVCCALLLHPGPAFDFAVPGGAAAAAKEQRTFIVDMARAERPVAGLPDQLFCLDYFAGFLYRVDPATGAWALINTTLHTPHGLAIYQSDNGSIAEAYIAELKSGRLLKVDLLTGQKTILAEDLSLPARLAIREKDGALEAVYVTQLFKGSVVRLAPGGPRPWQAEVVAEGIPLADGIALEPGGTTAIVSTFFSPGSITRISLASGEIRERLPAGPLLLPAQFAGPVADGQDSIFYISEMLGQRITKITCAADGSCQAVKKFRHMKIPCGIALSQDASSLYVAESFSGRILRISVETGAVEAVAQLPRPEAAQALNK